MNKEEKQDLMRRCTFFIEKGYGAKITSIFMQGHKGLTVEALEMLAEALDDINKTIGKMGKDQEKK